MGLFQLLTKTQEAAGNAMATLASLVKILVYPSGDSPLSYPTSQDELIILGNGPSLKPFLRDKKDFCQGRSLLAVNYGALSDEFTEFRPEFYMLVDPAFFFTPKDRDRLFPVLREKVTWPMHLFVSGQARKEPGWKDLIKDNKNIQVHYISIAPIEGYRWFCHLAYRKGWGMPRPRNVLIPSIMTALRMNCSTIYVAGADHSWLKEIWVDEDNNVMEDLQHFYDKKGSVRSAMNHPLHELLYSMYVAFRSYHIIQDYCKACHKNIFNITQGSFIDAFPRKSI